MINFFKYTIKNMLFTYLAVLSGILIYLVFMFFQIGVPTEFLMLAVVFSAIISAIITPFLLMSITFAISFNTAVSHGCTRANAFRGLQLCKLTIAFVCSTLGPVTAIIFYNISTRLALTMFFALIIVNFFLSCWGELMGAMTHKYGGFVAVISGILLGLSYASIGFIVGLSGVFTDGFEISTTFIDIESFIFSPQIFNILLLVCALSFVCGGVFLFFSKKITNTLVVKA